MRRGLILWLLLCGWVAPLVAVTLERSVAVDGRTRSYRLFVPAGIVPDPRLPLVLAFHGGGGASGGQCSTPCCAGITAMTRCASARNCRRYGVA